MFLCDLDIQLSHNHNYKSHPELVIILNEDDDYDH